MLEIIKPGTKINFSSKYKLTSAFSVVLVVMSLFLVVRGLNYGVDFRGGAEILLNTTSKIDMNEIRKVLQDGGFKSSSVQSFGDEESQWLVKVAAKEENLNQVTDQISKLMQEKFTAQGATIEKIDIVGPKAGEQLRISGFQAMLFALLAIMIYIGLRFDFKYSPGAIVALFHDVTIILGVFAVAQLEFTLQIVAALLAVIGYSVNDTVVIYDRVREHEEKYTGLKLEEHINNAASETLSRTILTSGTTLFVSLAMYFFGGQSIKDFFFAISLGVIIGTYSSLFVAAPVTLFMDKWKKQKEAAAAR